MLLHDGESVNSPGLAAVYNNTLVKPCPSKLPRTLFHRVSIFTKKENMRDRAQEKRESEYEKEDVEQEKGRGQKGGTLREERACATNSYVIASPVGGELYSVIATLPLPTPGISHPNSVFIHVC